MKFPVGGGGPKTPSLASSVMASTVSHEGNFVVSVRL